MTKMTSRMVPSDIALFSLVGQGRYRLFRQRDFGQLNCNVITRPLIIKISNDAQRNDKPTNNQRRERFHRLFSSSYFARQPRRSAGLVPSVCQAFAQRLSGFAVHLDMQSEKACDRNDHDHYTDDVENISHINPLSLTYRTLNLKLRPTREGLRFSIGQVLEKSAMAALVADSGSLPTGHFGRDPLVTKRQTYTRVVPTDRLGEDFLFTMVVTVFSFSGATSWPARSQASRR